MPFQRLTKKQKQILVVTLSDLEDVLKFVDQEVKSMVKKPSDRSVKARVKSLAALLPDAASAEEPPVEETSEEDAKVEESPAEEETAREDAPEPPAEQEGKKVQRKQQPRKRKGPQEKLKKQ